MIYRMSDLNYVVVHNPGPSLNEASPPFREGDVLSAALARQWEPAGVLLLPVHAPHLPQRGGVGSVASTAYQRHEYGGDGVLFDGARFAKGCPAPVCMPSSEARVEWMARVEYTSPEVSGNLRLVGEETAHGFIRVAEGEARRRPSCEFLRGSALVSGTERCFGAVCLAGACVGVRVLWLALTVLPRDRTSMFGLVLVRPRGG